jgi:hypothetical protein
MMNAAGIIPHIANPDGAASIPNPMNDFMMLTVVNANPVFGKVSVIDSRDFSSLLDLSIEP